MQFEFTAIKVNYQGNNLSVNSGYYLGKTIYGKVIDLLGC